MAKNDGNPDNGVIPMSFCRLTKGKDGNHDLIKTIDKLVIMNSKIAIRRLIAMNHLMSFCISNHHPIPKLSPVLIRAAFSYGPNIKYQSNHLARLFHDPDIDIHDRHISGKGWMIDNLVKTY